MTKKKWQTTESNSSGFTTGFDEYEGPQAQNVFVGTASTGLIRMEWHMARNGQQIPTNWSQVMMYQFMAPAQFTALGFQVDDAQNVIVSVAMEQQYDWLLLWEHDNLPAPDSLVRLSQYMKRGDVPVISGLYFTRSIPSEPLVYRGRGTLAYDKFDLGDLVWCDGVPTGFLLIHMSIIKAMWEESEEYMLGNRAVRRVFNTPRVHWFDPETGSFNTQSGTSDLAWCRRVIDDGFFAKAGWPEYQEMEFPFLVDTNIMVEHIQNDNIGRQYPPGGVRNYWPEYRRRMAEPLHPDLREKQEEPPALGVSVSDGIGLGEKIGG